MNGYRMGDLFCAGVVVVLTTVCPSVKQFAAIHGTNTLC
jgi:hypothetical protein